MSLVLDTCYKRRSTNQSPSDVTVLSKLILATMRKWRYLMVNYKHIHKYPTGGSFRCGKAAGAWSWPLTSFSAEVKDAWSYTATPQYAFMAWCSVKKITWTISLQSCMYSQHSCVFLTVHSTCPQFLCTSSPDVKVVSITKVLDLYLSRL